MIQEEIWKKKVFRIDDTLEAAGYTRGAHWNGWECPAFEKTEAEHIIKEICKTNPFSWMNYDNEKDTFLFMDGYNLEEWKNIQAMTEEEKQEWIEEWEGFDIQTDDGIKHVYAIGAYAWIWDTDEEEGE